MLRFRFKRNKILTKKQLYGFSYMKWKELQNSFNYKLGGFCSFCFDAMKKHKVDDYPRGKNKCHYCKIDKELCGDGGDTGLFMKIAQADTEFYGLVNRMIFKLKERYDHE